ncbi:hypothetical protein [Arthrobacter sp. SX1312]|uniref:hypothetical protein n=1 Tax=Arthrobacter sp. SX1312 TaxID=2058896 RepID=UPI0011AFEFE1|nr:hypothetical protein [Arthrobacter sp. SX1312]
MAMVARFRVATRASGIRRQVWVHVYDDVDELARAHNKDRGRPYDPDEDIGGGLASVGGWHWPQPDPGPVLVMRLWTKQLTTRTVAHEATHAAAVLFFADHVGGWDSRARTFFLGDNETLAYLIGDITSEVIGGLYRLHLLPSS